MTAVVGAFKSMPDAERGIAELKALGIPADQITLLPAEASEKELAAAPTSQGEQPGMVKTMGAIAGGGLGAGIGYMIATLILPGAGFAMVFGIAGGALLGAIVGGTVGEAVENSIFASLPEEELFVYEDALRQGRTVVLATPRDESLTEAARSALDHAGAESVDRAREMWWIGLRDIQKEHYGSASRNLDKAA